MVRYLSWTVCLEDDCKTSIKTVYRKPIKKDQYLHFAYGNTPSKMDHEQSLSRSLYYPGGKVGNTSRLPQTETFSDSHLDTPSNNSCNK